MKKLIAFTAFSLFATAAFAQQFPSPPSAPVERHVQMTCTNTTDCPIKVQYETDMLALQAAQQAVQADMQNYYQNVILPAAQSAANTQLSVDKTNMATFQASAPSSNNTSDGAR